MVLQCPLDVTEASYQRRATKEGLEHGGRGTEREREREQFRSLREKLSGAAFCYRSKVESAPSNTEPNELHVFILSPGKK